MKRKLACLVAAACMFCSIAYATEQTITIPVTVTIVHTVHNIDVTMPVAFPVSVLDGNVLTASDVKIMNNSTTQDVEVSGIQVLNAGYTVSDYDNFDSKSEKCIAMSINGCATKDAGELEINREAFPVVAAGQHLPLVYHAKVSDGQDVSGVEAAQVIFTIKAVT